MDLPTNLPTTKKVVQDYHLDPTTSNLF